MKRCRILFMILLLAMFIPVTTKAAGKSQSDAVSWANSQIGKGLDYDGQYGNQCVDLIKYYYDYLGVAGYAIGNANAYITNNLPSGWTRVYSGYQPGDIAVWKVNHSCGTCSTGKYGHVGIIISADSAGFNAVNQNFNDTPSCTRNWFNLSALQCAIRPAFSASPSPAITVSFADFNQNGIWETNAEMYIKIMNPNRATVSKVGCYLYNSSGTLLKSYSESVNYTTAYVNYNCNINNDMKYTLTKGTTYKFVLYAVVNGKEYKDITRTFTTKGSAVSVPSPTISDIQVSEFNGAGYTVKCKVSDVSGITKVQFPTWTELNGQDDIVKDWTTNKTASGTLGADGYYSYFVSVADHNFESGLYHTHIYAYNNSGKSSVKAINANIPLYCFKAMDKGAGIDTVLSKDVCIVEGRILLPEKTSFSNISIRTSVKKNGKTITKSKNYGAKVIPGGSACYFEQLVDRKDFNNAGGIYTTEWIFEKKDGTSTRQTKSYNMSVYSDTVYTKANRGDTVNLYEISKLSSDIWECDTNTYYQNNIYNYITKPSAGGEVKCLNHGRAYIIWRNNKIQDRKIQVLDIQIKTTALSKNPAGSQGASGKKSDVKSRNVTASNSKLKLKKVSKIKCKKKKKYMVLTWKKVVKATGYQVQLAQNKTFSKKKKKYNESDPLCFIKVKKKGKYYIRVRAYAYQNGKKVYGKWSKVKKVKIKK